MEAIANGQTIQLSEAGWLENLDEWSPELAYEIAKSEQIAELTEEVYAQDDRCQAPPAETKNEQLRSAG